MQQDAPAELVVEPDRIIAALRRKNDALSYENAVLSAAVDQLTAQLKQQAAAGE